MLSGLAWAAARKAVRAVDGRRRVLAMIARVRTGQLICLVMATCRMNCNLARRIRVAKWSLSGVSPNDVRPSESPPPIRCRWCVGVGQS